MEAGFQQADSHNLPTVDVVMVSDFMKNNSNFNQPETSSAKASRSGRENYGDAAIGFSMSLSTYNI